MYGFASKTSVHSCTGTADCNHNNHFNNAGNTASSRIQAGPGNREASIQPKYVTNLETAQKGEESYASIYVQQTLSKTKVYDQITKRHPKHFAIFRLEVYLCFDTKTISKALCWASFVVVFCTFMHSCSLGHRGRKPKKNICR